MSFGAQIVQEELVREAKSTVEPSNRLHTIDRKLIFPVSVAKMAKRSI
jgi:hypothetical protein